MENFDPKSDFPADVSMARFKSALKGVVSVSKDDLRDLMAKDQVSPQYYRRRGPKPKSLVRALAAKG